MTPVPPAMPAAVFATRFPYRFGVTYHKVKLSMNFKNKKNCSTKNQKQIMKTRKLQKQNNLALRLMINTLQ